jgi:hypothetical protein
LNGSPLGQTISVGVFAVGTDETVRPSGIENGLKTGFFGCELALECEERIFIVCHDAPPFFEILGWVSIQYSYQTAKLNSRSLGFSNLAALTWNPGHAK